MSNNNNCYREISMTGQFKRDVKKHCSELISKEGIEILGKLIRDLPLPEKYSDHKLSHSLTNHPIRGWLLFSMVAISFKK